MDSAKIPDFIAVMSVKKTNGHISFKVINKHYLCLHSKIQKHTCIYMHFNTSKLERLPSIKINFMFNKTIKKKSFFFNTCVCLSEHEEIYVGVY